MGEVRLRRYHVIQQVLRDYLKDDIATGAEVGVWRGESSEFLLRSIKTLRLLYLIDPWREGSYSTDNDPFSHGKQTEWDVIFEQVKRRLRKFGNRYWIIREKSSVASKMIQDGVLDFVFIDGDHAYYPMLQDCRRWWQKLKPSGIMLCHDYASTSAWCQGVQPAFDQFAGEVGGTVTEHDCMVASLKCTSS